MSATLDGTTKQNLMAVLRGVGKGESVPNPDRKSNLGTMLHRLFIWQELATAAEAELKRAWKAAQAKEDGICDADDLLRELGTGQSEVCNSKHYALLVDVKTPASRVDTETFYKKLAKRFGTTVKEIERIADDSKVDNKASLTKKVVERV